jgi:hypothetical protein
MRSEVFSLYYVHHGRIWRYNWTVMCAYKCPTCRTDVEPFMSVDESGEKIMHVGPDFVPEHGWPNGVTSLEALMDHALESLRFLPEQRIGPLRQRTNDLEF